jgi:hypothetical protein
MRRCARRTPFAALMQFNSLAPLTLGWICLSRTTIISKVSTSPVSDLSHLLRGCLYKHLPSRRTRLRRKKRKAPSFGWGLFAQYTFGDWVLSGNTQALHSHIMRLCVASPAYSGLLCCGHCHGGRWHVVGYRGRRRAHGLQPASFEPGAGNGKLRPAAIQTYQNVRRRRHGWVAESTRAIAIQPNLRRYKGESGRLALGADHGENTSN